MKALLAIMLLISMHVHGECTIDWRKGCHPKITSFHIELTN